MLQQMVLFNNTNLISSDTQLHYRQSRIIDFLTFLCPSLTFIEIKLIGRIFLAEILLLLVLFILVPKKGHLLLQKGPRMVLILGVIWLIAQMITDLIRATPFEDFSRGWAKITFLMLNFSAIYLLLVDNVKRIILFTVGLAIGDFLNFYINPSEFALSAPWKFGLATPTSLLVVLIAQWRLITRIRLLPELLIVTFGGIAIYLGSRSLGGFFILSGLLLYIHHTPKVRNWFTKKRVTSMRTVILLIIMSLSAWGTLTIYGIAASSGMLGEEAEIKYRQQSGDYGVLLGGRIEILASSQAIMDSPLIGHGSWAKDPKYRLNLLDLEKLGYEINEQAILESESNLIPSHSHLFGAWVEAGILGALFWAWIFTLVIRTLYKIFKIEHVLLPLLITILIGAAWSILFSPFGALERLRWGFFLTLFLAANRFIQQYETNHQRNKTNT